MDCACTRKKNVFRDFCEPASRSEDGLVSSRRINGAAAPPAASLAGVLIAMHQITNMSAVT
jgi:hypothetical protein